MDPKITEPIKYVTIAEFCERFGIGKTTYYKMRANGTGPAEFEIGARKRVITEEAIKEWTAERTHKGHDDATKQ